MTYKFGIIIFLNLGNLVEFFKVILTLLTNKYKSFVVQIPYAELFVSLFRREECPKRPSGEHFALSSFTDLFSEL